MHSLRREFRWIYLLPILCLTLHCYGADTVRVRAGSAPQQRILDPALFHSKAVGWTVAVDLGEQTLSPARTLLTMATADRKSWLSVAVTQEGSLVAFSLLTDYKDQPLIVAVPVAMLEKQPERKLLLRYRGNALDLFLDGVLVDQEWPLGNVVTSDKPRLLLDSDHPSLTIWDHPIADEQIAAENGGPTKVAARADRILGPQPEYVQYSRPRGYNTNAGDAMPYFHDGIFHLYYLLDRRQHHSKWGLGAHQWAHMSSPDLVHWTHDPIALGIDHDWEGSICTGSVFFNGGKYYAFYATRLRDRSEHLAMAEGPDAIHFRKIIPSPFAEPAPPYVHGPNRDPFVFRANGKFHMIATAAVPGSDGKSQGALEQLTSIDLVHWTVEPAPFLLSGTSEQPECSDLFQWGDRYYLLYSLSGVTHYKIAQSPLGPWTKPGNDILDGPEAIVMKAAPFRNHRFLAVGFVEHDNRYGGDLVFRELVQEQDGSLGSKFPKEMMRPILSEDRVEDIRTSAGQSAAPPIDIPGDVRLNATINATPGSRFAFAFHSSAADSKPDRLIFDSEARTVTWMSPDGTPERAHLVDVSDLSGPMALTLVIHGTIADLQLNGHRTLVHRLIAAPVSLSIDAERGELSMTRITKAKIR